MESPVRAYLACVIGLIGFCEVTFAHQETNAQSSALVTNVADMLPYVEQFAKHLDLDIPTPLTTNYVVRFVPYQGYGRDAELSLENGCEFDFDVKHDFVGSFRDLRHMLAHLSREQMKSLRNSSKITQKQALEMARRYLAQLGYSETNSPVLHPRVIQAQWQIMGEEKSDPLPFFTVKWPWREQRGCSYCSYFEMEIDGVRLKVNSFDTLHGSPAEESVKSSDAFK